MNLVVVDLDKLEYDLAEKAAGLRRLHKATGDLRTDGRESGILLAKSYVTEAVRGPLEDYLRKE